MIGLRKRTRLEVAKDVLWDAQVHLMLARVTRRDDPTTLHAAEALYCAALDLLWAVQQEGEK